MYGSHGDFEATKGVVEWRTRAATAPATTTTAGWAAELAVTGQGDWFNAIMAGSIFQPVAARGMNVTLGRYAQISMPTRAGDADHCRQLRRRGRADPGAAGGIHRGDDRPQKDGGHHLATPARSPSTRRRRSRRSCGS